MGKRFLKQHAIPHGIRISDGNGEILKPTLHDIIEGISNANSFYWSILFLDGTPNLGQGVFLSEYEEKVKNSEQGVLISWEDLEKLSSMFFQMFEITILGCRNKYSLHRYEKEEDMQNACDIVIDLIDCAFLEVFSKDLKLSEIYFFYNKTSQKKPTHETAKT